MTKEYATTRTERTLGKRRMNTGEVRLVRVTIQPLTDVEAAAHQAEYEKWKDERAVRQSMVMKGSAK